jgi:hypothetical protein
VRKGTARGLGRIERSLIYLFCIIVTLRYFPGLKHSGALVYRGRAQLQKGETTTADVSVNLRSSCAVRVLWHKLGSASLRSLANHGVRNPEGDVHFIPESLRLSLGARLAPQFVSHRWGPADAKHSLELYVDYVCSVRRCVVDLENGDGR